MAGLKFAEKQELAKLESIPNAERTAAQNSRLGLLEAIDEDWRQELREMDD